MKNKNNKITLLSVALMVILLGIAIAVAFLVSAYYTQIYGIPRNVNGVIDLSGRSVSDKQAEFNLAGEWEFFYNDWIVTDNVERECDFMISLPGRWSEKRLDGKTLGPTGYASYRIRAVNISQPLRILVRSLQAPVAYRVFINGKLNVVSGIVSKNLSESLASGINNQQAYYDAAAGETLTVVIEVSANREGGLFITPHLRITSQSSTYTKVTNSLVLVMMGIIIACAVYNFLLGRGIKTRKYSSGILFISILFNFLTSKEFFTALRNNFTFNINYMIFYQINIIANFSIFFAFLSHLLINGIIKMNRKQLIIFPAVNVVCIAAFYLLRGYTLQIIPLLCFMFSYLYILYLLNAAAVKKTKYARIYSFILLWIIGLFSIICISDIGLTVYRPDAFFSYALLVVVLLVNAINFLQVRENANKALKAARLELEVNEVKHKALKAQIGPHFIFNSLTGIQALYHKDIPEGDKALERFARHLRLNIDSGVKDLIPFEQELKNIRNYFELENMRWEQKLNLLLDINFTDFEVPILSLQPLLENAIKYAGTQYMEDGYIQIVSELIGDTVVIQVKDNGKGFNTESIGETSNGIKNITERLKYLLNASVTIKSSPGAGTVVTVEIPVRSGL